MPTIDGEFSPGFEPVAEAFQTLFTSYGEMGAGLCLIHEGEMVVDLWGGSRTKSGDAPWQRNTRSNLFSASKPFVAVAVLQLVEKGVLDLDAPIAEIWPEFGCNGKASISLRQVLCHRSGLNAFHPHVEEGIIYDWSAVTSAIAAEHPWWEPGTQQGYSPMLFGWLLGEVVRRASGADSFDAYVQQHICEPLDLQLQFGLSDEQVPQVADSAPLKVKQNVQGSGLMELMRADPRGVVNRAFANPTSMLMGTNQPAWRKAEIPAANGQAGAGDLAKFYASLADLTDERLLSAANRSWIWEEQSQSLDRILNNPLSISLGFMRLLPQDLHSAQRSTSAKYFCHPGAGGTLGFGDAEYDFGLGYVTRGMGQAVLFDERADYLLAAVYRVLNGN